MNPYPPPGDPGPGAAPRSGWLRRRPPALAIAIVAVAAIVAVLVAAAHGIAGRASTARAVSVSAALVNTVDLQSVPGQVITLTSAQATLRLPASTSYAVSSQVTSGYVHVGVPQDSGAARTVTVAIDSGELELLPR